MKTFQDAIDYFKRVRSRRLGNGFNGGLPTREPRNGRVIVHNQVAHTLTQIPGVHGFRAWTQIKDGKCVSCRCGWSGIPHFRYRGMPAYIYDGGPMGFDPRQTEPPKMRKAG
jgi:hypothetical protein